MWLCQPDGGHKNERANERASERAAAVVDAAAASAAAFHLFFMLMIKLRQETDAEKTTKTAVRARCNFAPPISFQIRRSVSVLFYLFIV